MKYLKQIAMFAAFGFAVVYLAMVAWHIREIEVLIGFISLVVSGLLVGLFLQPIWKLLRSK